MVIFAIFQVTFLAAMSSSRGEIVTKCVHSFVCPFFFLLVSLEIIVYLECYKASKSVKGGSGVCERSSKGVF